jgi:hypothetical protein
MSSSIRDVHGDRANSRGPAQNTLRRAWQLSHDGGGMNRLPQPL